ncbi:MAG: hypothetical protein WAR37_02475 [Candidatus Microsaccharimonas sp.]
MITPNQAELHNNSMSLERRVDGEYIQLHDPFNGERIEAGKTPRSIENQPDLKAGIDYLKSHPDIELTILAENHGKDDVMNKDEIRSVLDKGDSLYLEGFGALHTHQDELWDIVTGRLKVSDIHDLEPGYQKQQYEAIEAINIPALLPEVPGEGSQYERDLLEFVTLLDELRLLAVDDENIQLAIEVNLAITSIMREWYMVAKIGSYLSYLERAGLKSNRPILWIGSSHAETMEPKLKGLGVNFKVIKPQMSEIRTEPESLHEGLSQISYTDAAKFGLSKVNR